MEETDGTEEPFDVETAIQRNPLAREVVSKLKQLIELNERIKKSELTKQPTVWEMAVEESRRKRKGMEDISTIYFLGSQNSGKTSLLNIFLEKEQATLEPTLALDFSFARRVNASMERAGICHLWELGGDAREWTNLIDIPVTECHNLSSFSIFIVLDLSQPKSVWSVLEAVVNGTQSGFKQVLAEMDKASAVDVTEQLEDKLSLRLSRVPGEDRKFLDPFHLPLVIIGTKYDLFQNSEPETVKTVSRILRLAAHLLGGTLCFFSTSDPILKRRFREVVSHYAFSTAFPKETCYDNNEALFIPHGTDSFEQIWPSQSPAQLSLDFCRLEADSKLGKDKVKSKEDILNPALDPRFAEPDIDRRWAECKSEIERERNRIGI